MSLSVTLNYHETADINTSSGTMLSPVSSTHVTFHAQMFERMHLCSKHHIIILRHNVLLLVQCSVAERMAGSW